MQGEKDRSCGKGSRKRKTPASSIVQRSLKGNVELPNTRKFKCPKIFKDFVRYKPNGECDASLILSKACYDSWLKTRKRRPKYPEESFRRAVTAHVKGSDGRRPFPPGIEAALLVELKKKQHWPCFSHMENKIGVLGYQKLGYHEERRSEFSTLGLDEKLPVLSKPEGKRNRKNKGKETGNKKDKLDSEDTTEGISSRVSVSQSCSETNMPLERAEGSKKLSATNDLLAPLYSTGGSNGKNSLTLPSKKLIHVNESASNCITDTDAANGMLSLRKSNLMEILRNQNALDPSKVSNMFKDFFTKDELEQFLQYCNSQGNDVINPSVFFMLNKKPNINDPRLQESFLVPDTGSFVRDRPIGEFMIDNTTLACLSMDETMKSIIGGDATGFNPFVLACSQIALLKQMNLGFRSLVTTGETWMHIHIRRMCDMKQVILLAHMQKVGPNLTKARCQDVSEEKKWILDLPANFL